MTEKVDISSSVAKSNCQFLQGIISKRIIDLFCTGNVNCCSCCGGFD